MSDEPTVRQLREGVIPRRIDDLTPPEGWDALEVLQAHASEYMSEDEIEAALAVHAADVRKAAWRTAAELLRVEDRIDEQNLTPYTRHKAAAWLERLADG